MTTDASTTLVEYRGALQRKKEIQSDLKAVSEQLRELSNGLF